MSDERKKLGAMFWTAIVATVLFAVFVLYPLSQGPHFWLSAKLDHPKRMVTTAKYVYYPLAAKMPYWPGWYTDAFVANVEWWSGMRIVTPPKAR
jgi:hypothetical protein